MNTVLEALRSILGEADFYKQMTSNSGYSWDYAAMIEYLVGAIILMIVVSSVFKLVLLLFKRK